VYRSTIAASTAGFKGTLGSESDSSGSDSSWYFLYVHMGGKSTEVELVEVDDGIYAYDPNRQGVYAYTRVVNTW